MDLKAKQRITGSYGTVNEGDTISVVDSIGEELIAKGVAEKTSKINDTATPEEVSERNASGLPQEPVHADGTNRDILNTDGRRLHESGPEAVAETEARAAAEVEPVVLGVVDDKDTETAKKAKKA